MGVGWHVFVSVLPEDTHYWSMCSARLLKMLVVPLHDVSPSETDKLGLYAFLCSWKATNHEAMCSARLLEMSVVPLHVSLLLKLTKSGCMCLSVLLKSCTTS